MSRLTTTVCPGQILTGALFNEPMRVETVVANGQASWVVGVVGTKSERFRKVTLTADDLARLTALDPVQSFDGDGRLLRLGLQAYALGIAYEFDPYLSLQAKSRAHAPARLADRPDRRYHECFWFPIAQAWQYVSCPATSSTSHL